MVLARRMFGNYVNRWNAHVPRSWPNVLQYLYPMKDELFHFGAKKQVAGMIK